jgi:hypothetical protein
MFDERNKLSHLVCLAVAIFAFILAVAGVVIGLADPKLADSIVKETRSIIEITIGLILLLMLVCFTHIAGSCAHCFVVHSWLRA